MPAKAPFSKAQYDVLLSTLKSIKKRFKNQEQLALALNITQPSLSALLHGKWKPSVTVAKAIAHLDSRTLEDLIGPYGEPDQEKTDYTAAIAHLPPYPNLEVCVRFFRTEKSWSPWTLAAARAGFFGDNDIPPPGWSERLDFLERSLDKLRKDKRA